MRIHHSTKHIPTERIPTWDEIAKEQEKEDKKAKMFLSGLPKGIPPEHVVMLTKPPQEERIEFGLYLHGDVLPSGEEALPHVRIAHELGHQKMKHRRPGGYIGGPEDRDRIIREEKEAWEVAARDLYLAGEWNDAAKRQATAVLALYMKDRLQAERFIKDLTDKLVREFG